MQTRVGSKEANGHSLDQECKEANVRISGHPNRPFLLRSVQFLLLVLILGTGLSLLSMLFLVYRNEVPIAMANCDQESENLVAWIRSPWNLMHKMNDSELFWRASLVPRIKMYPFRRIPKIAFMFLIRGPLPLAPLWERFFKGHERLYSIYIHSSPNSYPPIFLPSSVFHGRQIPSQVTKWGNMSLCDAERRLLANALLDISNEWFVLLSESCIPIQSFRVVYRYISGSKHSFIGAFDEPGRFGRSRYNRNLTPEVNLSDWRKGSQWFQLSRELAIEVVQDSLYYPKFKRFCTPECFPDEHYIQTMLSIRSPWLLANRSVTWVDWSRKKGVRWTLHPAKFGRNAVSEKLFGGLVGGGECVYNGYPTKLCFLFARKFDPTALDPLLHHAYHFFGY